MQRKKHIMQGLLLLVITLTPLHSATVSFLVIEAGLPTEAISQQAAMWEDALMDVFFEAGHIVSNSPIIRIRHMPGAGFPDEAEGDYELAREGRMDYFIVAVVNHPAPHNVSLRLFRTNSQELIMEHTYTDRTYRTKKEEYDSIRDEIGVLAARVR